ncbi:type II toxin-antitoxin system HigB family toxin [Deinococcus roseus]|uniref:Toxin RelE n=1 Tax=Deinococcus roseus TaxID=392414 RepID=A0ABQ2CV66_9DEIO|nr:type II toxin-antitoxin system HigB family toxin [Deinococcus roseus]GGJ23488.1 toxin RelE [Deinococcus roseus]
MDIIGINLIDDFIARYSDAEKPLKRWITVTQAADWKTTHDVRSTFNTASFVPPHTVFNIKGNDYRLISEIDYEEALVVVTHVLTHEEYDRDKWK